MTAKQTSTGESFAEMVGKDMKKHRDQLVDNFKATDWKWGQENHIIVNGEELKHGESYSTRDLSKIEIQQRDKFWRLK